MEDDSARERENANKNAPFYNLRHHLLSSREVFSTLSRKWYPSRYSRTNGWYSRRRVAISGFAPDVFVDAIGAAGVPVHSVLCGESTKIVSVHYPTISSDMCEPKKGV